MKKNNILKCVSYKLYYVKWTQNSMVFGVLIRDFMLNNRVNEFSY